MSASHAQKAFHGAAAPLAKTIMTEEGAGVKVAPGPRLFCAVADGYRERSEGRHTVGPRFP